MDKKYPFTHKGENCFIRLQSPGHGHAYFSALYVNDIFKCNIANFDTLNFFKIRVELILRQELGIKVDIQ